MFIKIGLLLSTLSMPLVLASCGNDVNPSDKEVDTKAIYKVEYYGNASPYSWENPDIDGMFMENIKGAAIFLAMGKIRVALGYWPTIQTAIEYILGERSAQITKITKI